MLKKSIDKFKLLPVQLRATFWFLICSVLQKGISVISTPIFTRLMSTSEYGKFNVFLSWQGIAAAIVILTLPWGVVEQGVIKFSEKRNQFISAALGIMTTLILVWFLFFLLSPVFWCNLVSLTYLQILCLLTITWTNSVFTFWSINQRVDYRYKCLVILTVVVSLLKPVISLFLFNKIDDKATGRIIAITCVELTFNIPLFINMIQKGRVFYSRETWIYVLRFNLPLIPHYISQRILNSSDRIMIERMCSESDAGIYSLAYSLSMLMTIVNQSIQSALNPWFFQKIKENKEREIQRVVYPALFVVAFANLFLIAFTPEVVRIFAPSDYYDAIWVVPPVAMSSFFMFLYAFFANIEFYYEKTELMSVATMIGAGLNIGLNYIFIRRYGYIAAGYTTLACYIIYALCHYLFMCQICKQKLNNQKMFNTLHLILFSSSFIILGIIISLTYNLPIARYSLIIVMFVVIFFNRKHLFVVIRARSAR